MQRDRTCVFTRFMSADAALFRTTTAPFAPIPFPPMLVASAGPLLDAGMTLCSSMRRADIETKSGKRAVAANTLCTPHACTRLPEKYALAMPPIALEAQQRDCRLPVVPWGVGWGLGWPGGGSDELRRSLPARRRF